MPSSTPLLTSVHTEEFISSYLSQKNIKKTQTTKELPKN